MRRADAILERFPGLRRDSPACALLVADPAAADRLTAGNVNAVIGPTGWPPLLLLSSSRYRTGDATVAAARLDLAARLLELGADPNAGTPEAETVRGYRTVLGAADPEALNYAGQTPLDCALGVADPTARDALAALLRDAGATRSTPRFDDPAFAAVFEPAADAVVDGDVDRLRALLREHPELATARSSRPHRCTLLHYLAANGMEGERQRSPAVRWWRASRWATPQSWACSWTPAWTSTAGATTARPHCIWPPSTGTPRWSRPCSRTGRTPACGTRCTTARRPAGRTPPGTRTSRSASPRGPGRSDGRYWTRTSDP